MHVTMILGSRNSEGQTARAAHALAEGLTAAGGECTEFFLPRLKIERCRQCQDNGWGICRTEGQCVIDDDFASLVAEIERSDAVVFATPVYFGDLSESMRAFLDRLRRTSFHKEGKTKMNGKPAIGICVAGGGGGGTPTCIVSLEKVLRTCDFDVLDLIPVRRQNLSFKVDLLRLTGQWLASQ
jgi:multimeric flavodoxin WrbA